MLRVNRRVLREGGIALTLLGARLFSLGISFSCSLRLLGNTGATCQAAVYLPEDGDECS